MQEYCIVHNKKKVFFIITKGNFGGAQRYVFDLVINMSRGNFDIVVGCGEGELLMEKLKEANIRTIKIESLGRDIKIMNEFKVFRNLIKIIKTEKPDIIHLNSSKIGLLGGLVALYFRILNLFRISDLKFRALFTAHGWAFNEERNLLSKMAIYFLHWLTIILSHTTIAVSEKARGDIDWLPFIKNKIKVVYNGIEKFEFLPKEKSDKTVIFSIGELHKNKGVDVALRGLALLPKEVKEKIIYNVAGDGEEKENLEKLVRELHIENIVRFLGFVPEAKKLLSGADIFLLPSRTEAFPYAILEAGLVGLPIIATNVGGISEIIRNMQNGILIHPRNPKEIAEAIMYYLDHEDKVKEFGREIRKTISNFFTLEKMLSETIKIYKY